VWTTNAKNVMIMANLGEKLNRKSLIKWWGVLVRIKEIGIRFTSSLDANGCIRKNLRITQKIASLMVCIHEV
jgi:hypothetical protein